MITQSLVKDSSLRPLALTLAGMAGVLLTPALAAQGSTSREVVQPLPSGDVQRLNRALMELARRPTSLSALLEAGDASVAVGDLDAAIGFYGRAAEAGPSDPRVKLGLARVYLRSGRPIEAIPLFEQASRAGARPRDVLSDQALAYDLVGDQTSAQEGYARAIELAPQDDEARRRLALSHAISGNADQFQATLAPLLQARDTASFRARAFGLAILGEQERAEGIVDAVMPADLSARINPYLAYMPRLTPAQQAAAANLGIFPRAADIGREDPRIARFASEGAVGSRLEPRGEPFGRPSETSAAQTVSREVAQAVSEPAQSAAQEPGQLPRVTTRETGADQEVQRPTQSVNAAFSDLGETDMPSATRPQGAVDLAAIEVRREAPPPPPQPVEPEHPRRIWVQLATGRDVEALGFDWRRIKRRAENLLDDFEPHVTP
jgi:Flp pilus assembly protein TadD